MSDEKWWFGLVARTFAKMCPALGIEKEVFSVHHKSTFQRLWPTQQWGIVFLEAPRMVERDF